MPVEERLEVIRHTVQSICQNNIESTKLSFFDGLSRCLIYLDDVPSSLKVFEQCTTIGGDVITHNAYCSLCKDMTDPREPRYVCKLYSQMNLCAKYFAGYKARRGHELCQDHEFLGVPTPANTSMKAAGSPLSHMSRNKRDQWLKTLRGRYQIVSGTVT
jgi:hypothetical protein